ncbi:MAG: hypothetical protein ACP5OR_04730 [Candidatus Dormibacteria bacterium]
MLSQLLFGLIFMIVVFIACAVIMVFLSFILPDSSDVGKNETGESPVEDELIPRSGRTESARDGDAEEHTTAVG